MPFASKEVHWKDAGYDGPLPDGTVLLHSSASCTASTGLYTFKLIHGSIAESASRFGVNTKKNMTSSDAAKAAALTRIKKGEIETFEVLLRHINKSDAGNGMEEDPGEEDGGMAGAGTATHHAPRAGQGQRASSYSPQEQLQSVRLKEFRARHASSSSSSSVSASSFSSPFFPSSSSSSSSSSPSLGGNSKGTGSILGAKDQSDKGGGAEVMTVASMDGVAAAAATFDRIYFGFFVVFFKCYGPANVRNRRAMSENT